MSLNAIEFRLLVLNTHLLPPIAAKVAGHRSDPIRRAERIGELAADYDLVALCEVFDKRLRMSLERAIRSRGSEALQSVSNVLGPKRSGRHLTHSGLMALAKPDVVAENRVTFQNFSRYISYGLRADGFAAKGMLHLRLRTAFGELDCFLTHLESQSSVARLTQLEEMRLFCSEHLDPNRPALFVGDFNVAAQVGQEPTGEYQYLLKKLAWDNRRLQDLHSEDPPLGTSDALADDGGQRIDYVFLSTSQNCPFGIQSVSVSNLRLLDSTISEGSLSDHCAIDCKLRLVAK